ncbi:phage scaffolding protein [Anaerosalibacter massiliensis]|uniref:Phage scaffolding protein n=1 Tax=Anaerosalibacter massiliensis TaxID=1347392 RepID=A0A9X2MGM7_9FIRM|nr:phage scaffolding protein [Anaerosalibacter massiliensis]MCR2043196.1 phage scaffolding protein [Anaerosalibacter massiliensis]
MDWILKLVEKHTKDGVLDQEALMKDINKEFPNHAVPKEQYNTLADTKKKLEGDIATRDKQLEDLKEIDAEGLQKQIETLQEENRTAKEDYEKELKGLQLSNAIKLAINGKVHDEELVAGLVDKEKVVIDDGKVIGLDEQIQSLQESKSFLFKEEKQEGEQQQQNGFQKIGNEPPNNVQAMDDAIAAAFGNTEE